MLEKLREEIKLEIRGKLAKELLRLYDNESPHTPAQTKEALKGLNMEILPHPSYSPFLHRLIIIYSDQWKKILKGYYPSTKGYWNFPVAENYLRKLVCSRNATASQ